MPGKLKDSQIQDLIRGTRDLHIRYTQYRKQIMVTPPNIGRSMPLMDLPHDVFWEMKEKLINDSPEDIRAILINEDIFRLVNN